VAATNALRAASTLFLPSSIEACPLGSIEFCGSVGRPMTLHKLERIFHRSNRQDTAGIGWIDIYMLKHAFGHGV
jgi:hypothetical protein